MSYRISDGRVPVGYMNVFEVGIDPEIERLYRTTGAGRVLSDYVARCGEEFVHRNAGLGHVIVNVEREPAYMPLDPNNELPKLSIGFYIERPLPEIKTFDMRDVSFGGRPVRISDSDSVYGKPNSN